MKMSSFIFATITLVLLIHMNQLHFTTGHRVLTTWPWIPLPPPRTPFPWTPLPPPTTPVTPPAKPESPPAKPVTPPAKPKTPPAKPVTPPAKPETPPAKPVTPPAKPETSPAKPVAPPSGSKEKGTCQMNYGSCVRFFKGLIHWEEGDITAGTECCSIFGGLIQYESAWCLCKSFKGQFFGINFDIPIAMNMTMNFCNKKLPNHFSCP